MLGLAETSDARVKYHLGKAVEFLDAMMVRQLEDQSAQCRRALGQGGRTRPTTPEEKDASAIVSSPECGVCIGSSSRVPPRPILSFRWGELPSA
jgi:hypothetical protein